jgi:hypothetical protein
MVAEANNPSHSRRMKLWFVMSTINRGLSYTTPRLDTSFPKRYRRKASKVQEHHG